MVNKKKIKSIATVVLSCMLFSTTAYAANYLESGVGETGTNKHYGWAMYDNKTLSIKFTKGGKTVYGGGRGYGSTPVISGSYKRGQEPAVSVTVY